MQVNIGLECEHSWEDLSAHLTLMTFMQLHILCWFLDFSSPSSFLAAEQGVLSSVKQQVTTCWAENSGATGRQSPWQGLGKSH